MRRGVRCVGSSPRRLQSDGVVGGAYGVEVGELVIVGPAVAHDAQFIGDGADLAQGVVEGVAEATEAFGEHAQLTLQVGTGVAVPAAALRPVDLGEDGGPVAGPGDRVGEAVGYERVEVSTEGSEQVGDGITLMLLH
jgi:hypothetical protein